MVGPGGIESVPPSGVLHEISQRQTELAILELDIKRAELQKKLRDLQGGPPGQSIAASPPLKEGAAGPTPANAAPVVRRIHRAGGELAAVIILGHGETKTVRRGGEIANGLRVVEIHPDAVLVRRGDDPVYPLPASPLTGTGQ